jgi:hypothetical protein
VPSEEMAMFDVLAEGAPLADASARPSTGQRPNSTFCAGTSRFAWGACHSSESKL